MTICGAVPAAAFTETSLMTGFKGLRLATEDKKPLPLADTAHSFPEARGLRLPLLLNIQEAAGLSTSQVRIGLQTGTALTPFISFINLAGRAPSPSFRSTDTPAIAKPILSTGLAYDLNDKTALSGSYDYLNADDLGLSGDTNDYTGHQFKLRFTYRFD